MLSKSLLEVPVAVWTVLSYLAKRMPVSKLMDFANGALATISTSNSANTSWISISASTGELEPKPGAMPFA